LGVPRVEGRREETVNAIDLLRKQHRQVEELFEEFESTGDGAQQTRERLCREISDELAVHAEIEEKIFYPEAKQDDTEELLRESVEEHLAVKRLVAEIMEAEADDEQLKARMKVLKEQVEHHVREEEKELFPRVRKECTPEELDDLGDRMETMADRLFDEGDPSKHIPEQTDRPAPI
jgi:hemerythrin superfamily protein